MAVVNLKTCRALALAVGSNAAPSTYDFGADWRHDTEPETQLLAQFWVGFPGVIAGKRGGPPDRGELTDGWIAASSCTFEIG